MKPHTLSKSRARKIALVLTSIGGFVDALAYLALYHIYVANMSGNTVSVAINLARRDWLGAFHRFVPVGAFVLGLLIGDVAIEVARRQKRRRLLTWSIAIEIACLACFLGIGLNIIGSGASPSIGYGPLPSVLVALAAAGMGAQNVSIRAVAGLHVYTTHVTGTLTALGRQLVRAMIPGGKSSMLRLERGAFLGALWIVYLIGAGLAAWSWLHWGLWPLIAPLGLLLLVIIIDYFRPIGTRQ